MKATKNKKKIKYLKLLQYIYFKKIYNEAYIIENNDKYKIKGIFKIKVDYIDKYDLNKYINDNINDNNIRYLLLEIKSNLAPLIIHIIKIQNQD